MIPPGADVASSNADVPARFAAGVVVLVVVAAATVESEKREMMVYIFHVKKE